ncbi:ROK family transcriptional regulator [Nitratireductor sp. StC3]|uniref:ROK family transcriptional regulator n=1 Tax=Nitratireductor sp. StC3 TaxID=2126741 RepID=UPI000D0E2ECF|nr:ROK family transcriptional regulator [Nitratireductor sp. StC3]PSM16218.1 sugar kinase [Nitratireductor sp. StC3]
MTAIARSDDVRRQNRRLVLSVLRRSEKLSRTEITARTGLSPSTVSAITSDLLSDGILCKLRDGDATATRRGRPQVALGLNPDAAAVIAVVLSLNALSAALIDYAGDVIVSEQARLDTLAMSGEEIVASVRAMVGTLVDEATYRDMHVPRIAVAFQGITDAGARTLLWSPITREIDIPLGDALENAFGIPVTVENDCNMIAVALKAKDPGHYGDNFIAILLSHGLGMGMMVRGELFIGTKSSGGEFGHMNHVPDGALCRCGRRGCIEAYAGNYAIWRAARGLGDDTPPAADIADADMAALAAAARATDGPERRAFDAAGRAIGFGLGSLFAILDPAPVAIVGQGALAFDLIRTPMLEALAKTAGGQHHSIPSFYTDPDEMPLIRAGCAMRALAFVDREIFARGAASPAAGVGRAVA